MGANRGAVEPIFQTNLLVPKIERIGQRDIEVTYLGVNSSAEATWILWNASEPELIGLLRQSDKGFVFEQRTSVGSLMHNNLSRENVQLMLGS